MTATTKTTRNANGSLRVQITLGGETITSTLSAKKAAKGGTYHMLVGVCSAEEATKYLGQREGLSTIGNWSVKAKPVPVVEGFTHVQRVSVVV